MVYFILRVYYIFILRPLSIGLGEQYKKMGTLSNSLVDGETLPNHIEIIEFLSFFFTREIYFLLTSNLFVVKPGYFLIKLLCPFSDAIIGFEKLLIFVNNLRKKNSKNFNFPT